MNKIRGYKGMESDMSCRGMKYEIGKKYHVEGEIDICRNGMHFCERLIDVFIYYPRDGNRFFAVEASGVIKTDGRKCVTSDMQIVGELDDIEINKVCYGCGYGYGNGYGCGYGYGYVNGSGDGDGYRNINKILLFA